MKCNVTQLQQPLYKLEKISKGKQYYSYPIIFMILMLLHQLFLLQLYNMLSCISSVLSCQYLLTEIAGEYTKTEQASNLVYICFLVKIQIQECERQRDAHHHKSRARNNGANVSEPRDCEGDDLKKQVYEVAVLPIHEVIAATDEEKHSKSELVQVDPEINQLFYQHFCSCIGV